MNATGDAPFCSPKMFYECAHKTRANYVRDNEAAKCNCPRQCRNLIYEPTISQSQLATSAAVYLNDSNSINSTVSDIVNDHCIVEVGKSSLSISHNSFSKCYTLIPDFCILFLCSCCIVCCSLSVSLLRNVKNDTKYDKNSNTLLVAKHVSECSTYTCYTITHTM